MGIDTNSPMYQKFLKSIEKKGDIKLLDSLSRQEELDKFREEYGAGERTPLACPICSHYMNTGRLYRVEGKKDTFVCRTCKTTLLISGVGNTMDYYIQAIIEKRKVERAGRKQSTDELREKQDAENTDNR